MRESCRVEARRPGSSPPPDLETLMQISRSYGTRDLHGCLCPYIVYLLKDGPVAYAVARKAMFGLLRAGARMDSDRQTYEIL